MLVVLLALGLVSSCVFWLEYRSSTTVHSMEAGIAELANHSPAAFGESVTSIETSKGSFVVSGIFQLLKSNPLVIETRKNGDRNLCDQAQGLCKKLLE